MGPEAEVGSPRVVHFNRRGRRVEKGPSMEDVVRTLTSTKTSLAGVVDGLQSLREAMPEACLEADNGIVLAHQIEQLLEKINDLRITKIDK